MRKLSKANFAKEAGVTRQALTKACKGAILKAIIDKEIDLDHPDAQAYIKKQQDKKTKSKGKEVYKEVYKNVNQEKITAESEIEQNPVPDTLAIPPITSDYTKAEALDKVLDLTLRQLVVRHGTDSQFKEFVAAHKMMVDVKFKNLQMDELTKSVISREFVREHIMGAFENINLRLLTDTPKTITRRLKSHFKSGGNLEAAEDIVKILLSEQLSSGKKQIQKKIKDA